MKKVGKVLSVEGRVLIKHANGEVEVLKAGDIIEMNDIVMCKNPGDRFVMVMESGLKLEIGEHTYVLFDQDFINSFLRLTHHLRSPFYAEHALHLDPIEVNYRSYRVSPVSKEGEEGGVFLKVHEEIAPTRIQVTVEDVVTNDRTPPLRGTVSSEDAQVEVIVDDEHYNAVNNGDGTWELPDDILTPLDDGDYEVTVIAVDRDGNEGEGKGEIKVDATPPVVTVEDIFTNDPNPPVTGTIDDPNAKVTVTVNGEEYEAVNNGDGTWSIADDTIKVLPDGEYEIIVVAVDEVGNKGEDEGKLVIDTTPPVISVDDLNTSDETPPLTGKVDDPEAVVKVTVNGEEYEAVNNGDGTWSIADNVISPLKEGEYTVTAVAVDPFGNSSEGEGTLKIDSESPTVTIEDTDVTHDDTPTFEGTVENADRLEITLNGVHYDSNDPDSGIEVDFKAGTWEFTVPDDDALDDGKYTIDVKASNDKGKESSVDDDFIVDADMPAITIKDYEEIDTGTPTLEGTYENAVRVEVHVGGEVYTSEGENPEVILDPEKGTWSLTIPEDHPLDVGDQTAEAFAFDEMDNEAKADDTFFVNYEVPPVAVDDIVLTNIVDGSTMELPDRAFLFNDYDLNNDPVYMYEVKNVESGIIETEANGDITNDHYANLYYTPDESPFEHGSFDYSVTDGQLPSNDAHVEIIAAAGNTINGTEEDEILVSAEREDEMFGGGGNDVFVCYDLSRIVDGGEGFDMLLAPNHMVINFNCFSSRVTNLEQLDVLMDDHEVTSVGVDDVFAITDENNVFQILGDEGDTVYLDPGWTYKGEETLTYMEHHIHDYNVYTGVVEGQEVTLYIESSVHVVG